MVGRNEESRDNTAATGHDKSKLILDVLSKEPFPLDSTNKEHIARGRSKFIDSK